MQESLPGQGVLFRSRRCSQTPTHLLADSCGQMQGALSQCQPVEAQKEEGQD